MKCVIIIACSVVGVAVGSPGVFCVANRHVVFLGVVFRFVDLDVVDAVAASLGVVGEGVRLYARLQVLTVEEVARTPLASRFVQIVFISRVFNKVELDDAVATMCHRLQGMVVDASAIK